MIFARTLQLILLHSCLLGHSDNGQTWTAQQLVYSASTPTQNITAGTPTAVVDMVSVHFLN